MAAESTMKKELTRREALGLLGAAAGAGMLAGACGESPTGPTSTTTTNTTNAACAVTPSETVGPYPSLVDLFRSDIREGRGGLPVSLTITVVNSSNACAPIANANVEIWQCDADGHYSQYAQQGYDGRAQTYLRGIQTTDSSGRVTFTTVYPGWYQGRATHIHVEVTINGAAAKITQIAFPDSVTAAVYSTGVYAPRGNNPTSNARDGIFADSLSSEMATVVGDTANGYTATFTVAIAV